MRDQVAALVVCILFIVSSQVANAQPAKPIPKIGLVYSTGKPGSTSSHTPLFDTFQSGLRELGYLEGKNIVMERRFAEGSLERMPGLVSELVQEKVDVIFAVNNVVIRAAQRATKNIPIVMISSVDPVDAGYVQSFANPGGNITGLAWLGRDLSAKRVELLKELLPKLSRVAVLWDVDGPGPAVAVKEYEAAARAFRIDIRSLQVKGPSPDFARAFQAAKAARIEAMIVVGNALMSQNAKQVFELAEKFRVPAMTEERRYVDAGGLISYGANLADLYYRAAEYVANILKGTKPSDLPVKLASRFEIFVNLKTAKELNLTIPQHVLVQADKVIQ